jgi:hypothetical protein
LVTGESATSFKDGVPAGGYFVFASVALFCAAWDARMLIGCGVFGLARNVSRNLQKHAALMRREL